VRPLETQLLRPVEQLARPLVSESRTLGSTAASASTPARPLPIRTVKVGLSLCIAITGLAAKISLALGREKRTKVRPAKMAANPTQQTISVAATTRR
jgi:hypothetical protein